MTSAKRIRELVDILVASGGTSTERLDRLDLTGRPSQAELAAWAEVAAALPILGVTSVSAMDALGDEIDLAAAPGGEEIRFQVGKTVSATTAFCLTVDGVRTAFADFEASPLFRQVWVACDFASFRTESCRVDPWDDEACEVAAADNELRVQDPRRLVKDFVGKRVPKSVFPHLLASDKPAASAVFDAWQALAVPRLLHSLVNEVVATDIEQLIITGTRPRKIDCDVAPPYSQELFEAATDAARWVYGSGRDVDTRFTLFTYELSREWPEGVSFKGGFAIRGELALEAAQTAFSAHVRETSKDTLKSLGDLRKTLSEEVTKVVSQTRDLLGTMWRDFMVAATAFLGRTALLGADKPLNNSGPLKALLCGAAVYLVFSLLLSLRTNGEFMRIAEASRADWRRKLYGFLNDEDFQKLSDAPLKQSTQEYKRAVRWVIGAYLVVIGSLLWSAWGADAKAGAGGHATSSSASVPAGASAPPAASMAASQPTKPLTAPSPPAVHNSATPQARSQSSAATH